MANTPENEHSAEFRDDLDGQLARAIGRIDGIVRAHVSIMVDREVFEDAMQRVDMDADFNGSINPATEAIRIEMNLGQLERLTSEHIQSRRETGNSEAGAQSLGRQDAVLELIAGAINGPADLAYQAAVAEIYSQITGIFNHKLASGFRLDSLGGRVNVSTTTDEGIRIVVSFLVQDDGVVKKSVFLYTADNSDSSSIQSDEIDLGPADKEIISIDVMGSGREAAVVDVLRLEREVLVALEQTIRELSR